MLGSEWAQNPPLPATDFTPSQGSQTVLEAAFGLMEAGACGPHDPHAWLSSWPGEATQ